MMEISPRYFTAYATLLTYTVKSYLYKHARNSWVSKYGNDNKAIDIYFVRSIQQSTELNQHFLTNDTKDLVSNNFKSEDKEETESILGK